MSIVRRNINDDEWEDIEYELGLEDEEAEEDMGENDMCWCDHKRSSHDGPAGSCGAFINGYLGDCPCERFDKRPNY